MSKPGRKGTGFSSWVSSRVVDGRGAAGARERRAPRLLVGGNGVRCLLRHRVHLEGDLHVLGEAEFAPHIIVEIPGSGQQGLLDAGLPRGSVEGAGLARQAGGRGPRGLKSPNLAPGACAGPLGTQPRVRGYRLPVQRCAGAPRDQTPGVGGDHQLLVGGDDPHLHPRARRADAGPAASVGLGVQLHAEPAGCRPSWLPASRSSWSALPARRSRCRRRAARPGHRP